MEETINVLVWSEQTAPEEIYPNGINATIAEHLNERSEVVARKSGLPNPEQGVSGEQLEWADVLFWWGHVRHNDVTEETVDRVERAVREDGLGFVALHSGHYALPFKRLIGESGDLGGVRWEDPGEPEVIEAVAPDHPIANGIEDFALPRTEMFDEPFDIPEPDDVVFHSTFPDGGEFRSVVTFTFDKGRGAYIRPGHETVRIYHDRSIRRLLANIAQWAAK